MKNNEIHSNDNNGNELLFCRPFLDYISRDIKLDEETKILIAANCKLVKLGKGEKILTAGNRCKYGYFIVSGECISYFSDTHGKPTTWFFHFNNPESNVKNLIAVDYKSFFSKEPATLSIETLSALTAIRFSHDEIEYLVHKSPIFERWKRMHNAKLFLQTFDRIATLINLSAIERYKKLLREEPWLLNMFANYLIATYLDVTPQSLSRIRKNCQ